MKRSHRPLTAAEVLALEEAEADMSRLVLSSLQDPVQRVRDAKAILNNLAFHEYLKEHGVPVGKKFTVEMGELN